MKSNNQNIFFDRLYSEHYEKKKKKMLHMTHNYMLSEDITQNTFLIIYLKYYSTAKNDFKINFPKSFLFTIARNLLFNFYEHEKVVLESAENLTLCSQMSCESSINCAQLLTEVTQLLDPLERDIFVLWCFYGYTLKEISSFVHLSPSKVFLKLKNSKIKLRAGLRNTS